MGDFDADGRSDLICRIQSGAQYIIALSGLQNINEFCKVVTFLRTKETESLILL